MGTTSFGQELRQIRERQGFGLNKFARILDVSPGYLSNLETGKTDKISLEILDKLFKVLEIQVCPVCHGALREHPSLSDSNVADAGLVHRIHALHSHLLHMAKTDSEGLRSQLDLLEHGWFGSKTHVSQASRTADIPGPKPPH